MLRQIKQSIVHRLSSIVKKQKTIILCLLGSLLLILSFNNGNLWLFAWVGFVPLYLAIQSQSKIKSFLLAYFTGVIFWLGTIYWLIHVTLPGMILLVLYLALYFGVFGFILSYVNPPIIPPLKKGGRGGFFQNLFFIPSLWVILEYIRSHFLFLGFPWALLGYSQYRNLPVIQIADITGVWGVSFLVMMANVAIYSGYRVQGTGYSKIKKCFFLLLFILIILIYGFYKISEPRPLNPDPRIKISVIQGNIPQELKWDSQAKDSIVDKYLKLTSEAAKTKPDLIIWPEASLPVVLEEEPEVFEQVRYFVKQNNTPLLLGMVRTENDNYYNSAVLISKDAQVLNMYDKVYLVPFGEYIPLKNILPFLEEVVPISDFTSGKEWVVFKLPAPLVSLRASLLSCESKKGGEAISFSSLICFEDVFPQISRNFALKGADFLVNITNDAWFKKTAEPYQHLQASVFRAVENRLNVVRSANTGVSAFINPTGEIVSKVADKSGNDIFIDGFDTQEITVPKKKTFTFYTRFGDVFVLLCLGGILVNALFVIARLDRAIQ